MTLVSLLCLVVAATAKAQNTQLHAAAYGGHVPLIRLLVANGANVNVRNENGWTPLHAAAAGGYPAAIDALTNCGAKVHAEDRRSRFDRSNKGSGLGRGASPTRQRTCCPSQRVTEYAFCRVSLRAAASPAPGAPTRGARRGEGGRGAGHYS